MKHAFVLRPKHVVEICEWIRSEAPEVRFEKQTVDFIEKESRVARDAKVTGLVLNVTMELTLIGPDDDIVYAMLKWPQVPNKDRGDPKDRPPANIPVAQWHQLTHCAEWSNGLRC